MDLIGTVTGFPKWARIALVVGAAVALLGAVWGVWLWQHDKGVVAADRAKANASAVSQARTADESAHAASEGKSQEVEAGNADAASSARQSDDPLKAGLDSLRNRQR